MRTTLIAMPDANWQWEASLLHIWELIQDEEQWAGIPQLKLVCSDRNGYSGAMSIPIRDKSAFVEYYLKLLTMHDFKNGCFMLTLNLRDVWGMIHRTRRWAFISKEQVLEER